MGGWSRRDFLKQSAAACCALAPAPTSLRFVGVRQSASLATSRELSLDSTDFSDLRFLAPLLADVQIVQLGENGHGTSEATRLRVRIACFLWQHLGFDVVAFESSLFLCHLANGRAREAEAQRTLTTSLVGVWHTEEMLPLFETIRQSRASAKPIHLAGFDVQPIGSNRRLRPAFFGELVASVDPEYSRSVIALDSQFLSAYDKGSGARREYLRANGERMATDYERLAAFIEERLAALQKHAGLEAPLIARQEARSMAAYVRFQGASDMRKYAEIRDEGMFENLKFLAAELFRGRKIVVWGHNYHLRHNNGAIPATPEIFPGVQARSMGTWTRAHFGRRVFTIGQYEHSGVAVDNSRKGYEIRPPLQGTLEGRLSQPSSGPLFVGIREAAHTKEGEWLNQPVTARYNGQHPETLVPAAQYDALLMLPRVTPPRFLY